MIVKRIKDLCDANNMSLAALERETELANSSIRKWDKSLPSIEKAQKVAEYFGVTLDYLTGRTDDPHGSAELTDEEQKIYDAIMKGRKSDNPALKTMAQAMMKLLGIDEEELS